MKSRWIEVGVRLKPSRSAFVTVALGVIVGAAAAVGAIEVPAMLDRPSCAETVMKAVSTDRPVHGTYQCFDSSAQAGLQSIGIDSDSAFATQVGVNGEYHYLHKTADGGYVYEYDHPRAPHDRIKGTFATLGVPAIVADLRRGDFMGAWKVPNDFRAAWSEITGASQNESSLLFTIYLDGDGRIASVK